MEDKTIFKENQKQNSKWIWFLLIILMLTTILASIQQIIFDKSFGNHPIPNWSFIVIFGLLFIFFYLLRKTTLYTEITPNRILFQYKPFYRKPTIIKWEDVKNCYVRLYSPLKEFGGWGARTAFTGKNGKAYNVRGNIGIQLELKDGGKILIGTQKGKEAEIVINSVTREA